MNRLQLALAGLAIFALGGTLGAIFGKKPPPPVAVASLQEQDARLSEIGAHEARTDDAASVFRVLPAVKETKRKTTYHPPAPQVPPFPGSAPICNCPAPAIASVEETITETGNGSEAINASSKSQVTDATARAAQSSAKIQRVEVPVKMDLPRLTLGPGVGVKPGDDKRIVAALALDLRITDDDYLSLVLSAPPADIKQDFTAMLFLKLGAWK